MSKETLKLEIERLKLIRDNSIIRHKQRMESLNKRLEIEKVRKGYIAPCSNSPSASANAKTSHNSNIKNKEVQRE